MKEFLFKSTVKSKQSISKEICCAEHAYMNIHTLPPNYYSSYGPALMTQFLVVAVLNL